MLVSVASNSSSDPIPEARYSRAGGVYPGQDQFWLSMGQTDYGKKLSDTWILQLNFTDLDDIRGTVYNKAIKDLCSSPLQKDVHI